MSNLGGYQWLTTSAKKVGGPRNLVVLIGIGGAVTYKLIEIIAKKSIPLIKKPLSFNRDLYELKAKQYIVKYPGVSNDGVAFVVGEKFKALEVDKDVVLIEKIGDENNPYIVSTELLKKISDYN